MHLKVFKVHRLTAGRPHALFLQTQHLTIMEIPVFTIDAFTNVPFEGNPAAVCLLQQVSVDVDLKVNPL